MILSYLKPFTQSHYPMVSSWWKTCNEIGPELDMIPETSYILFYNNQPIFFISLILTNTKIAWLENLIGNPELKGPKRKELGSVLLEQVSNIAKQFNKTRLFCMSSNKKTTQRYIEVGFIKTLDNVSTFIRSI